MMKRVESHIGVVIERFDSGTHQQDHKNFSKKLKICVSAGGGHKRQVFEALSSDFDNSYLRFDLTTFL